MSCSKSKAVKALRFKTNFVFLCNTHICQETSIFQKRGGLLQEKQFMRSFFWNPLAQALKNKFATLEIFGGKCILMKYFTVLSDRKLSIMEFGESLLYLQGNIGCGCTVWMQHFWPSTFFSDVFLLMCVKEFRNIANGMFFKINETSKMFVFDEEICGDVYYKKHETAVEKLNALVSHVNLN